jgi:hypothetical protein
MGSKTWGSKQTAICNVGPNASLGAALSLLAQGNSLVKRLPQATTFLFYLFLSVHIAD